MISVCNNDINLLCLLLGRLHTYLQTCIQSLDRCHCSIAMNTQNQQTYFDRITQSSLSHRACQISQTSLLEILPDIISLVHSKSQSAILSDAGRYDLVGKLKGLLTTMTERKLDVTMEDWSLEARGEKKEKRIVNFKRTNASPEGLHCEFHTLVSVRESEKRSCFRAACLRGYLWEPLYDRTAPASTAYRSYSASRYVIIWGDQS